MHRPLLVAHQYVVDSAHRVQGVVNIKHRPARITEYMAIEMGAKAGLVAPDDTTFAYLKGRQFAPTGDNWEQAVAYWRTLKSDDDAQFDSVVTLRAEDIAPQVTWGTNPGQVIAVNQIIPAPESFSDPVERASAEKALAYMDLQPGIKLTEVAIDKVFIGS